jgi:hypothetical protein
MGICGDYISPPLKSFGEEEKSIIEAVLKQLMSLEK